MGPQVFPLSRVPLLVTYDLGLVRTDRGRRIAVSRTVEAPSTTVYDVLTRVEHWPAWGPSVTAVEYEDEAIGAGTTGRVQAFGLLWVPFRIESVTDAAWTWTVWGRTPPADGHRVERLGDGRSRVVLELPLWALWYVPLCALALRNLASLAAEIASAGAPAD